MAMKKYTLRLIGYVFKGLCALCIAAVVGLLLWRIIDSRTDPKEVNTLIPNDALCSAYEESGDKLTAFYQDQSEYTQAEDNYGYFAITRSCFIPKASQLQFSLRYNNSTLKYLKGDYSLPEIPDRDSDVFDVSVLIAYDLTPDVTSDNDGNDPDSVRFERVFPSEMQSHRKTLYNYRTFVFDGIDVDESVLAVYVDVYYKGDVDYDKEAYGTLILYDYATENEEYRISSSDEAAIREYMGK